MKPDAPTSVSRVPSNDGPKRVQLRRTKGWRMPPNTVRVTRPGPWGNRYRIGVDGDAAECVAKFRADCDRVAKLQGRPFIPVGLAGKNLACWCSLDQPCHADVLLELANNASNAGDQV